MTGKRGWKKKLLVGASCRSEEEAGRGPKAAAGEGAEGICRAAVKKMGYSRRWLRGFGDNHFADQPVCEL
jgi:hypothetical protein